MNPRIGIGSLILDPNNLSGLHRYVAEVAEGLLSSDGNWIAYTTACDLKERHGEQVRLLRSGVLRRTDLLGNLSRFIWHQTALHNVARRDQLSLFYSPVAEGMLDPPCPQVITIHDVLPLRYPGSYRRMQHYFAHVLPRIAKSSRAIIVDSEATRQDIQEFYRLDGIPIHVVYAGYSEDRFHPLPTAQVEAVKHRFGLTSYVLSVGETRPYKNIRALIVAFSKTNLPDVRLAIVGKASKMDPSLRDLPRSLDIEDRVSFLGYVSDEDLAALYGGALSFVFPSLYEGFGIPPLEAMACGCPVVVSRASSLPEVCGEAARYVDPESTDSIAAGIQEVCTSPILREHLRTMGLERARRFSFHSTATEIASILSGYANGGD